MLIDAVVLIEEKVKIGSRMPDLNLLGKSL
jgi:hypothetical protein